MLLSRSLVASLAHSLRALPSDARSRRLLQEHVNLLKLIRKVSGCTSAVITPHFLDAFRDLFVVGIKKDPETKVLSKWIAKRVRKDADPEFEAVYRKFYLETFQGRDLATKLTPPIFRLFHLLTLRCYSSGPLAKTSRERMAKTFRATTDPAKIPTLGFLWDVIFLNPTGQVFDKAAALLVKLFCDLPPGLDRAKSTEAFIDDIMLRARESDVNAAKALAVLQTLLN